MVSIIANGSQMDVRKDQETLLQRLGIYDNQEMVGNTVIGILLTGERVLLLQYLVHNLPGHILL
jgi:hypothetical protein